MSKAEIMKVRPIMVIAVIALALLAITAAIRLPIIPAYAGAMGVMAIIQGFQASAHRRAGREALSTAGRVVAVLFLVAAAAVVLVAGWAVAPLWVRGVTTVAAWSGFIALTSVEIWQHLRDR